MRPATAFRLPLVTNDEWLDRVAAINQHRMNGARAPHKPLLILLALSALQRTGSSAMTFSEVEPLLARLLVQAGRPANPEYPFFHLQSDEFWTVTMADGSTPRAAKGPLRAGATGSFTPDFEAALLASPLLLAQVATTVLEREFPSTLHADLLADVGLDIALVEPARARAASLRRRDPRFRAEVVFAYQQCCAFCGFDGLLQNSALGLEAAHVRWWAYDGPDHVSNGLCLCSMHHKLFDLGALTVDDRNRVSVSGHFIGRSEAADRLVYDLHGRPVAEPIAGLPRIDDQHIAWHRDQVFKAPARSAA